MQLQQCTMELDGLVEQELFPKSHNLRCTAFLLTLWFTSNDEEPQHTCTSPHFPKESIVIMKDKMNSKKLIVFSP